MVINTVSGSLHYGVENVMEPQCATASFVLTKQYFHYVNVGVWVLVRAVVVLCVGDTRR